MKKERTTSLWTWRWTFVALCPFLLRRTTQRLNKAGNEWDGQTSARVFRIKLVQLLIYHLFNAFKVEIQILNFFSRLAGVLWLYWKLRQWTGELSLHDIYKNHTVRRQWRENKICMIMTTALIELLIDLNKYQVCFLN